MKKRKFRIRHVLLAIIIFYVGYTFINQQIMISRISQDIKKYGEQNKKLEGSNDNFKDQIEYAKTKEYKERMARERIGLIMPGETVYIINEN